MRVTNQELGDAVERCLACEAVVSRADGGTGVSASRALECEEPGVTT
jgi:hypothetical protein